MRACASLACQLDFLDPPSSGDSFPSSASFEEDPADSLPGKGHRHHHHHHQLLHVRLLLLRRTGSQTGAGRRRRGKEQLGLRLCPPSLPPFPSSRTIRHTPCEERCAAVFRRGVVRDWGSHKKNRPASGIEGREERKGGKNAAGQSVRRCCG